MALGFSTGSSFGSRTIIPDKGMTKATNLLFLKLNLAMAIKELQMV